MNAVDLGMYYDERKLNAIREHYEESVEGYIEYHLNILFEEVVLYDEQNAIEELNLREEIEAKQILKPELILWKNLTILKIGQSMYTFSTRTMDGNILGQDSRNKDCVILKKI